MHLPSCRDLLRLTRVLLCNQSPQLHHTYLNPNLLPSNFLFFILMHSTSPTAPNSAPCSPC